MEIFWLDRARRELVHARDYIALDDPKAAQGTARHIMAAIKGLRDLPSRGRPGRLSGTRELVIGGTPYIALYRVRDGVIEILRIMHGVRKWPDDSD